MIRRIIAHTNEDIAFDQLLAALRTLYAGRETNAAISLIVPNAVVLVSIWHRAWEEAAWAADEADEATAIQEAAQGNYGRSLTFAAERIRRRNIQRQRSAAALVDARERTLSTMASEGAINASGYGLGESTGDSEVSPSEDDTGAATDRASFILEVQQ
ncbi:hypothetical protein V7S43_007126 [Phytophthora oleae]|uniref:Uncharacterized protein n=1 Tax=Phytophthora oleae TaxID=2107226 RepID=A0ABD3FME0_9STRA